MDQQRRTFLKAGATTGTVALLVAAGLIKPDDVFAARPEEAFAQAGLDEALNTLFGTAQPAEGELIIEAPEVAEDGALVPVIVTSNMATVESISLLASDHPQPLICHYEFIGNVEPYISTRVKLDKSTNLIAVIKQANGHLYSAKRYVQVKKSGCTG